MLTQIKPQSTAKVHHFQGSGNHVTKLNLQHRKTGQLATLHIFSRIPLSLQEVKESVTQAFKCDRWAYRQLSATAELVHF